MGDFDASNEGSGNVLPIRGTAAPASAVMKAARKSSGTMTISPREAMAKLYEQATEAALESFKHAAELRAEGDEIAAILIEGSASAFLETAQEIGEAIAGA